MRLFIFVTLTSSALFGVWDGNKYHNANRWKFRLSNYGPFASVPGTGQGGAEWPVGSGRYYIYGAGLWVGACRRNPAGGLDTLVSMGYNSETGGYEMAPGLVNQSPDDKTALVYLYPSPWPAPADRFPMAPSLSKSFQDAWAVYNDADPQFHSPFDTRPANIEVYQTSHCWNLYDTRDIVFVKFEVKNKNQRDTLFSVYLAISADNDVGTASDDVNGLRRWRSYIVGKETLNMMNTAFTCDYRYNPPYGCVGYTLLRRPFALTDRVDNDRGLDRQLYWPDYPGTIIDSEEVSETWFKTHIPAHKWDADVDGVMDWQDESCIEQCIMTAFRNFTVLTSPPKDWARYLSMAGYDFLTRQYKPYDSIDPGRADKRFCMASGPITLLPESSAVILIAVIGADYPLAGGDSFDLARKSSTAQYIYDHNWLLPGPPPSPNLVCVPGDHRVTLLWDNFSEAADPYYKLVSDPLRVNYDVFYREYDFAGYRVWRSVTGLADNWKLIGAFDLADGDTFTHTDYAIPEAVKILANDNGISYTFIDSTVRNGFTCFYAVTAYDHNYVKIIDSLDTFAMSLILEGGRRAIAASPRTHAAGIKFTPPSFAEAKMLTGNQKADLKLGANFPNPYMTLPKYQLTFDSLLGDETDFHYVTYTDTMSGKTLYYTHPVYKWALKNDSLTDSVMTGMFMPKPKSGNDYSYPLDTVVFPVFRNDGVQLNFIFNQKLPPNDTSILRVTMNVNGGAVPDSWPRCNGLEIQEMPSTAWAYSGEEYEINWKTHVSGSMTCEVKEKRTGRLLPFSPCSLGNFGAETTAFDAQRTAKAAKGWFFRGGLLANFRFVPTDTLHRQSAGGRGTKYLYIAGLRIALKKDGSSLWPGDPIPAPLDRWTVTPSDSMRVPPMQDYDIFINKGQLELVKLDKLNVKVVPNPYVITSEWEVSRFERKLKFINLPPECTIRIFTTNGELIKTIIHNQKAKGSAQTNELGGDEWWNLKTDHNQLPASGVYIFHVYSKDVGEQVGKFVIIR